MRAIGGREKLQAKKSKMFLQDAAKCAKLTREKVQGHLYTF